MHGSTVVDANAIADSTKISLRCFSSMLSAVASRNAAAGSINHHWTKSLMASADGSKLYVGVGSNSNAMERGSIAETNRAAILEVDPSTGAFQVFASGLRNPNGLTFYPGSDVLWTVVNERDELGPNLVPDYMTPVKRCAFCGWPYSYSGQHEDPRVRPQQPELVRSAVDAGLRLSSHVAPLGLAFYTGTSFPAQFAGGAFVGEHGSWNRPELQRLQGRVHPVPERSPRRQADRFRHRLHLFAAAMPLTACADTDACNVLTAAQVGAAVGVAVSEGKHVTPTFVRTCTWNASGISDVKFVTLYLQTAAAYEGGKQWRARWRTGPRRPL